MTHPDTLVDTVRAAFSEGNYPLVISSLSGLTDPLSLSLETVTRLGVSYLRCGQFVQAAPVLARAELMGSLEAAVESANLSRALEQPEQAALQFRRVLPKLDGELRLRALRWLGVTEHQLGQAGGLERIEEARFGYIQAGDHVMAARITQTLSAIYLTTGQHRQALQLLDVALPILGADLNKRPYLSALSTLADLQIQSQLYAEAAATLERATHLATEHADDFNRLRLLFQRTLLFQLMGETGEFLNSLEETIGAAEVCGNSLIIVTSRLLQADHHSRMGHADRAVVSMLEVYAHGGRDYLETRLMEALLTRRRGHLEGAYAGLQRVRREAEAKGETLEALRAWLQAVYTLYLMKHLEEVRLELPQLLERLLRFGVRGGPYPLRNDFVEVGELVVYARLDPSTAPLITSLLEDAAVSLGVPADAMAPAVRLELLTLGQQVVLKNDVSVVAGSQRGVVAILTYIALHPGATRLEIQMDLFPDKDAETGSRYVRRAFTVIQDLLGALLVQEGTYHQPVYRLSAKVRVVLDVQMLEQRLASQEVLSALALYKGAFLPDTGSSEWVQEYRSHFERRTRLGLESLLHSAQEAGDHRRVLLVCTEGLRVFPGDLELMDAQISAARTLGDRQALARFEALRREALN